MNQRNDTHDGQNHKQANVKHIEDAVWRCFMIHDSPSFSLVESKYAVTCPFVSKSIRYQNENHTDNGFEQADCGGKAHFPID